MKLLVVWLVSKVGGRGDNESQCNTLLNCHCHSTETVKEPGGTLIQICGERTRNEFLKE